MTVWTPVVDPRVRAARSWAFDVLVAAVVVAFALPYLITGSPRPLWVAVTGVACFVPPLLVRRVCPVPALTVVLAVAVGFGIWDLRLAGSLALPVALYSVAALGTRRQAYAAGAVLEVLVIVAAARLSGLALLLPLVLFTGMVVAALGLGLYSATRTAYVAELVDRAARLERDRDTANQLAAAAERTRIAREMHDIVAHHLTVMVALIDGATRLVQTDPGRASEAMAAASTTGREALRDTRRLLGVLTDGTSTDGISTDDSNGTGEPRAPVPDLDDLDRLIGSTRAAGLAVDYAIDGAPSPMPADTQLAVYRLVQEALTNTMKHAHPGSRATVALSYQPDSVRLLVEDDGAGEVITGRHPPGRGLTGMRARVSAAGGHLDAGPRPGGGWQVDARIPTTPELSPEPRPAPLSGPVVRR